MSEKIVKEMNDKVEKLGITYNIIFKNNEALGLTDYFLETTNLILTNSTYNKQYLAFLSKFRQRPPARFSPSSTNKSKQICYLIAIAVF